jgi:RNA polymerase sigma-70 factor (ECF subfamily)
MLQLLGRPEPLAPADDEEALLEEALVMAWAHFSGTIAIGLGVAPDFELTDMPLPEPRTSQTPRPEAAPFQPAPPVEDAAVAFFREDFGFVPNLFKAQASRPDIVAAEIALIQALVLSEEHLARLQKERLMLVVSAANWNTYGVTLHTQILATLGISAEESDQLALDHHLAGLAGSDKALLDFVHKLAAAPSEFSRKEIDTLLLEGITEEQALEAVVTTAFACFCNTAQFGLGVPPDFAPRRINRPVPPKIPNLSTGEPRPTQGEIIDPDAALVAQVKGGDLNAFEDLILRHSKRVFRTLVGILGGPDEAQDAMQDTFLKAFQHLAAFESRSKFSTWLVSIASNTGLQRLRERRPLESLDDDQSDCGEGFRPRQIRAWIEDPEQLYSRTERRSLVENAVMKLPAKYRVVLMLRDMEQLSTEETAAALGLGIPAVKSRLLRGRMMVREALAPHFTGSAKEVAS